MRCCSLNAPVAAANRTVKTMSGSSWPLLAAANGLLGIKLTRKSTKLGSSAGCTASTGGAAISGAKRSANHMVPIPITIAGSTVIQKKPSVKPPSFPSFLGSPSPATPVKMTAMTSGMTTILIAFMNAVPSGAEPAAMAASTSEPVAAASRPVPRPSARPSAIRTWSIG